MKLKERLGYSVTHLNIYSKKHSYLELYRNVKSSIKYHDCNELLECVKHVFFHYNNDIVKSNI